MSSEANAKSNNTTGKRTVFLFIIIIVVVIAFSWPAIKALQEVIEDKPPEGLETYNAYRYFFRFDHPEKWVIEREQNGFLLDKSTGLVVSAVPALEYGSSSGDDVNVMKYDTVKVSFFYNTPAGINLSAAALDKVMQYYQERMKSGLLGSDFSNVIVSGNIDRINVASENTDLYAADFKAVKDGMNVYGTLYCAKRPKCCYAVIVMYTNVSDYGFFKEEITEVVKSFRLTVLED